MAVLVLVGVKLLPESRDPGPWDLLSVLLSLVGVVAVVYAVKEAAVHGFRWDIGGATVAGVVGLIWFAGRQLTLKSPLLDMRLFRHRGFSGAVLADLLTILGLAGLVFFLSPFLQLVQMRTPLGAGLIELPAAIGAVATGLVAGVIARRFSVRIAVSGGLAAVGLALAACTALDADTSVLVMCGALFLCGAGAGLAFTVTADVILSSVPKEQAGAASAVSETAYEHGVRTGLGPRHRPARLGRHRHLPRLHGPRRRTRRDGRRGAGLTRRRGASGQAAARGTGRGPAAVGPVLLHHRLRDGGGCGGDGPVRDGGRGVVDAEGSATGRRTRRIGRGGPVRPAKQARPPDQGRPGPPLSGSWGSPRRARRATHGAPVPGRSYGATASVR